MTVRELYRAFDEKYPKSLSCEWDRDGLMVCPDPEKQVKKVLTTLDVTEPVVDYAIRGGFDVIVAHHPLLFNPVQYITPDGFLERKVIKLIQNDIAVMCFHTRADAQEGGVNTLLAKAIGLTDVEVCDPEGIVRVGYLPAPESGEAFAARIKCGLGTPCVIMADAGKPIHKVAICGGGGGGMIRLAREAGADAYLAGRLDYHACVDAPESGITLVEAGHWYTEIAIAKAFGDFVEDTFHITAVLYDTPAITVY